MGVMDLSAIDMKVISNLANKEKLVQKRNSIFNEIKSAAIKGDFEIEWDGILEKELQDYLKMIGYEIKIVKDDCTHIFTHPSSYAIISWY